MRNAGSGTVKGNPVAPGPPAEVQRAEHLSPGLSLHWRQTGGGQIGIEPRHGTEARRKSFRCLQERLRLGLRRVAAPPLGSAASTWFTTRFSRSAAPRKTAA